MPHGTELFNDKHLELLDDLEYRHEEGNVHVTENVSSPSLYTISRNCSFGVIFLLVDY